MTTRAHQTVDFLGCTATSVVERKISAVEPTFRGSLLKARALALLQKQ
jgi:hypothetical protein